MTTGPLVHLRVLVVGAHATSGRSMHRHAKLLAAAWNALAADVCLIQPPSGASRKMQHPGLSKWVGYVEKFLVFAPKLRWAARRQSLVHVADHSDAIWLLLLPRSVPTAVTVHDLFAVSAAQGRIPGHPPVGAFGRLYQRLVARGLRRADYLFAVSEATAVEVRGLLARDCAVVHNPLDPGLGTHLDGRSGVAGRDDLFLLVVGNDGWRKRRDRALAVWLRLRACAAWRGASLVVVGTPLSVLERQLVRDELGAIDVVLDATDAELRALYASCRAVLVLSSHEGFGWPVVEANAQGRPAVCSNIPVLREVAGKAAVFVDDELDAVAWDEVVAELEGTCAAAASDNAARFAWPAYLAALEAAVESLRLGDR